MTEHRLLASCDANVAQFISGSNRVFVACRDRWLVIDINSGSVIGTLFPSREGLVAILPEVGIWTPTEESRRFVRLVDQDLNVLRSTLPVITPDEFPVIRHTLLK